MCQILNLRRKYIRRTKIDVDFWKLLEVVKAFERSVSPKLLWIIIYLIFIVIRTLNFVNAKSAFFFFFFINARQNLVFLFIDSLLLLFFFSYLATSPFFLSYSLLLRFLSYVLSIRCVSFSLCFPFVFFWPMTVSVTEMLPAWHIFLISQDTHTLYWDFQ